MEDNKTCVTCKYFKENIYSNVPKDQYNNYCTLKGYSCYSAEYTKACPYYRDNEQD